MVEVAQRLLAFCQEDPEQRMVYRYRMGLFLLVLRGELLSGDDEQARRIESLAHMPVAYLMEVADDASRRTEPIRLLTRLGIATSDGTEDPEHIIRNSGMALDKAHETDGVSIYVYSDDLQERLKRINEVQDIVEWAIEHQSFYMLYQPQVDLRTHTVSGYEALVRVQGRTVSPAEFIPVAESSGLIRQIGRMTTELAVKQLAAWRDAGVELKPVSINYSSKQAADMGYLDYLVALLKKYDLDPSLIKIEITERFLMRNEAESAKFFERLEHEGIQILMDDFGTGYSSLNYLAYIPVDVIKLDKSIVDAFLTYNATTADEKKGNDFVRNLVVLTHDLGKQMLVEGVEEKWQADLLTEFGCDSIQGFYYSRPLLPDDAANWRPN